MADFDATCPIDSSVQTELAAKAPDDITQNARILLGRLGIVGRHHATLRTFADHAAIAIAHARALRQIEQLKEQLELENDYLREDVRSHAPDGIIGSSPALRNVIEQVAIVAPTTATVLIQGESEPAKNSSRAASMIEAPDATAHSSA